MASFNKVILIGNITRDIQVRYIASGTAVAEIGLAINRKVKDKDETTFVDVTLWGRTAEVANEYAKKGDPLLVDGRLQLDTWDDKETGQKRSKLRVVGENIQLLGGRSSGGTRSRSQDGEQRQESMPDPSFPSDSDIPF